MSPERLWILCSPERQQTISPEASTRKRRLWTDMIFLANVVSVPIQTNLFLFELLRILPSRRQDQHQSKHLALWEAHMAVFNL